MKFDTIRQVSEAYSNYLSDSWKTAVALAERSIAVKSDDPADVDVRANLVFQLGLSLFDKLALPFTDFLEFVKWRRKIKKRRSG